MTDKTLLELVAREDALNKRIERLESLEYETVAFPAGSGGAALFCDIILAAPAAQVMLCGGLNTIPQTHKHLWLIIAAMTDASGDGGAAKMRMTINSVVPAPGAGGYNYYTRQEFSDGAPVGATDTEATTASLPPDSDAAWWICHPAGFESEPGPYTKQCACWVQIVDYTNPSGEFMAYGSSWWGFASYVGAETDPDRDPEPVIDEGEGSLRDGARSDGIGGHSVGSISIAANVGEIFQTGSQFTLYGI